MNHSLSGKVAQGKLVLDNPSRFLVQLSKLEGQRVEVSIRKQKSQRSLNQNSYYFGVLIEILRNHFGEDAESMHEILKYMFLRVRSESGLERIKSTTKLNTAEFEEYLEKIRQWAWHYDKIFVPLPNDPGIGEVNYG